MSRPIEDYALIGDTETAALVSRDGSIDWLCVPRFDGGACFAALLGDETNGHWSIRPAGEITDCSRRYLEDSLVLETTLSCAEGTIKVIDFMPPRGQDEHRPIPDVIRIVEGVAGRVPVEMELVVRFDYGWVVPWVTQSDRGALRMVGGPDAVHVYTPVEMRGVDRRTVAEFEVEEGDRIPFVFTWVASTDQAPEPLDAEESLEGTLEWWVDWCSRTEYEGDYRDEVHDSLVVLKGLTYGPSGALVAAPTTSLPEHIGGVRNWDYRFTWIRDAAFTLYTLLTTGHREEAVEWRDWLLRAVAGDSERLQIMYGLSGERRLTEIELDWLPGYEGSAPVRIGNGAYSQRQLDVYGELMDTLHISIRAGMEVDEDGWDIQKLLMEHLEGMWDEPGHGLWEFRGEPEHFTHSKIMSWVAFDRAVATAELCDLDGPVDKWKQLATEIHREVCDRGFDAERNTFTQSYDSRALDAALLLIPQIGFLPPSDGRYRGTVEAIERELTLYDIFVHRYDPEVADDGLPGHEGAFLFCSFWLVDALSLTGRKDEARRRYEKLLDLRNDVGLLAEEWDPSDDRMLGNFPQAFSHVGLVNSAANLSEEGATPSIDRQTEDTIRS